MYLLDTCVWLEALLSQEKADEVRAFLGTARPQELAITDFSLYSIALYLTRAKKDDVFADFLSDTVERSGVRVVRLTPSDLHPVLDARKRHRLDFDGAYQYVAAAKHGYTLLSFDTDFDRTDLQRKTPGEILKS